MKIYTVWKQHAQDELWLAAAVDEVTMEEGTPEAYSAELSGDDDDLETVTREIIITVPITDILKAFSTLEVKGRVRSQADACKCEEPIRRAGSVLCEHCMGNIPGDM